MEDETTVFLNNIEEYVFDEDKVVTYKWLSQTLEVHVNSAKRLLETFIKEQAKKTKDASSTLNVTYAVTGTQETKNGTQMTRVAIVNENGLEDVKSSMKKVLGQHIFSVQKNPLKDSNALFTTDYEITKQHITRTNRFSAIQCEAAKARSKDELERLRDAQQPTSTSEKPKVNGFGNQSASSTSAAPAKPSAPKAKKGSLAASFAAQAERNKTKEPKKEEDGEKKKTEEKKKEVSKPKPKGMLAFMSQKKPNTPSTAPSLSPAGDADKERERSTKEEEDVEVEAVKEEEEEEPDRSKVTTAKQTQRKSQPEKKKRISVSESESDDEGRGKKVAKKRRRIIQQEDSSSEEEEDEEEEDMDDSPIPPTPPPQAEPDQSEEEEEAPPPAADQSEEKTEQSSGKGSGKRRIRKRVLRSKITMDEEGCMVTEKVWESESTDASEDDEPPPPPKPKPKKEEREEEEEDKKGKKGKGKKTSPPSSKGKQSTLMSFFKKK